MPPKWCSDQNPDQPGSQLYDLAPIVDPSDEIIEILLAALRWDMQERPSRFGLTAVGLDKLLALSVELLQLLGSNSHTTIQHHFKDDQRLGDASADTPWDKCNYSRLHEMNIWLWCYGRGHLQMVSIAEGGRISSEHLGESRLRAAETRKRRSEAAAAAEAVEGGDGA